MSTALDNAPTTGVEGARTIRRHPEARSVARRGRRPPQLSGRPRRLLRAAHVAVSGGWLGLVVAMLVLGAGAAAGGDASLAGLTYTLMDRIGSAVIPPLAVATLLTGLVLSVTTPWGLLRHWWVVVKVVLGLAVIVTGVTMTGAWIQQASDTAGGAGRTSWLLVAGSVAHLLMLGFATVISVDKPWGRTPRGRRLAEQRTTRARQARSHATTGAAARRR